MSTLFERPELASTGIVSAEPLRIYTGILGQIGDIIMFTATARRLRQLFPNSRITFAVSTKYRQAGDLLTHLPYIDRVFVTKNYFEKKSAALDAAWAQGWPVDLRGDDEVAEQRAHDVVLETRPVHRRMSWWEFDHQVAESAHMVGVPGPIDCRTDVAIPPGIAVPAGAQNKIVMHNDPSIDQRKAWPWDSLQRFVRSIGPDKVVLLGNPGPEAPYVLDLRGRTSLVEAGAIIQLARCYVGIDSGLMWIAGSLQVPTVGLYGTDYIPAYKAIQPVNPNAIYIQAEGSLHRIPAEMVLTEVRQVLRRHGSP